MDDSVKWTWVKIHLKVYWSCKLPWSFFFPFQNFKFLSNFEVNLKSQILKSLQRSQVSLTLMPSTECRQNLKQWEIAWICFVLWSKPSPLVDRMRLFSWLGENLWQDYPTSGSSMLKLQMCASTANELKIPEHKESFYRKLAWRQVYMSPFLLQIGSLSVGFLVFWDRVSCSLGYL